MMTINFVETSIPVFVNCVLSVTDLSNLLTLDVIVNALHFCQATHGPQLVTAIVDEITNRITLVPEIVHESKPRAENTEVFKNTDILFREACKRLC